MVLMIGGTLAHFRTGTLDSFIPLYFVLWVLCAYFYRLLLRNIGLNMCTGFFEEDWLGAGQPLAVWSLPLVSCLLFEGYSTGSGTIRAIEVLPPSTAT